jgi:malonate-semialdehyde dehydrogenase (acetylating)/methylmalonate-semialdehyde dehydrogenase
MNADLNWAATHAAMPVVGHFINGGLVVPPGSAFAPVFNPALGQAVRKVALASAEDVDGAVRAAKLAQVEWGKTPALQRARVMFRFKELLVQNLRAIAQAISEEHGKTVVDAEGEVTRGLEVVEFACGAPQLLKGEFSESVGTGVDSYGLRQPLGVVAGIQFSRHGTDVDVSNRADLRQFVHSEAI